MSMKSFVSLKVSNVNITFPNRKVYNKINACTYKQFCRDGANLIIMIFFPHCKLINRKNNPRYMFPFYLFLRCTFYHTLSWTNASKNITSFGYLWRCLLRFSLLLLLFLRYVGVTLSSPTIIVKLLNLNAKNVFSWIHFILIFQFLHNHQFT